MLNEKERNKAELILQDLTREVAGEPDVNYITLGDLKWIAEKAVELDDKLKALELEIEQLKGNA